MRLIICLFIGLGLVISTTGCDKSVKRRAISGAVKLDGKPIDKGQIQFVPVKGGPSAGTDIIGGQYKLEGPRGPGIGQYKIEITAYRPGKPGQIDAVTKQREMEMIQYVPTKFNENSELKRDITEANDSMTLDFDLISK